MTIGKTRGWRGLLFAAAALLALSMLPASASAAEPANATVDIPVCKQVVGDTPKTDDACTFVLKAVDGAPMPDGSVSGTKSVQVAGEGDVSFGQIGYTDLGEYRYTISEAKGNNQRYAYDMTVYSADVQVAWKDEVGGQMVATLYLAKEDGMYKQEKALFTNRYTMPTPVSIDPPVQKAVDGTPAAAETFAFRLASDGADAPMPDGSSDGAKVFSRIGPGQAEAGTIAFTEPGDYGYTVSEVDGGAPGYTYDRTVYTVKVKVTEEDGRLQQVTQYAKADGTAVSAVVFTNIFKGASAFPQTGDVTRLALCGLALAALSAAITAAAVWRKKRKQ